MCGVIGISGLHDVNLRLYDALTILQHRGQDAAGIVTEDGGELHQCKGEGLVRDVFNKSHMMTLKGNVGIGHVRYPTAGSSGPALAQPFYVNSPYGIFIAHNGNLTNAEELREQIRNHDLRHLNTDSDSEVLLNIFAYELQSQGKLHPNQYDIFAAIEGVHARCSGAYAVVGLIANYGTFAFRDQFGIRPLCYGRKRVLNKYEYAIVSESVVLESLGFEFVRDLSPGEGLFIDKSGSIFLKQCSKRPNLTQPRQQVLGEFAALRGVFDDGADFLLHPRTCGVADQLVLLGEELIHVVVVVSLVEVCSHGH